MPRQRIPDDVLTAAHDRARARAKRDWPEADRLRGVIESAGWRIVDRGTDFGLSPANPVDLVDGNVIRHGTSASVPSRLDEAPTGLMSVVVIANDHRSDVRRAVEGLRGGPVGTHVVIVENGPAGEGEADIDDLATDADELDRPVEIVRMTEPVGHATAWNAGLRRATADAALLLDPCIEPTGDIVTPLVAALADPTVGVAGPFGLTSLDLRRFEESTSGDAAAIGGYAVAFRRDDVAARGPLDEHFRFYRNLDVWWSLVLRDEGEERPPRRAVAVPGLPLARHEHRGWTSVSPEERDRLSKRNFYRVIDRFGRRPDLAVPDPSKSSDRGDGAA